MDIKLVREYLLKVLDDMYDKAGEVIASGADSGATSEEDLFVAKYGIEKLKELF